MSEPFANLPFRPADILLPRDLDLSLWSVVACDQYTSQPEYWARVEQRVGRAPSALKLILPESSLDGPHVETDITEINHTMSTYLRDGVFTEYPSALIYVERTLDSGALRRGLVGMLDLDAYDYEPSSGAAIRATEGVVLSRVPPRVAVRKNAPLELPHAMILTDDPQRTVIEPLTACKDRMQPLYDFPLMERGGRVAGWLLGPEEQAMVGKALQALADPDTFAARYDAKDIPVMLFAVGDGNHSLATAKECYERQKRLTPEDRWPTLPARYALCELVNLHDDSLQFEPIHRVVFRTDPDALLQAFAAACPVGGGPSYRITVVTREGERTMRVGASARLPVAVLQNFLDDYLTAHPGRVDYIHGADVAREFGNLPGNVAFLLEPMAKEGLFPAVIHDGILPRKTFSMGEAHDKRFYLEARKIR